MSCRCNRKDYGSIIWLKKEKKKRKHASCVAIMVFELGGESREYKEGKGHVMCCLLRWRFLLVELTLLLFIHKDTRSRRIPLLAIVALVSHRTMFTCGTSNFGDEPIPMEIYDLRSMNHLVGATGWCWSNGQSGWMGFFFFSFFFFNACTSMKAVWDRGILGRKNALNGHVQRTWPIFCPNRRVSGRKVKLATRWQVREGHLTILVHWRVNRHPVNKTGG
jgi:hypothetical protein